MKAIEATATINSEGQLTLDLPINVAHHRRVRVIVLIPESEEEIDPDDDSTETVIEGIREGWQQALAGEVRPISELWDDIDA
ncbi:MAG: hypothetical protein ACFE0I_20490 [Elainellaceae cyanobacterium]